MNSSVCCQELFFLETEETYMSEREMIERLKVMSHDISYILFGDHHFDDMVSRTVWKNNNSITKIDVNRQLKLRLYTSGSFRELIIKSIPLPYRLTPQMKTQIRNLVKYINLNRLYFRKSKPSAKMIL